MQHLVVDFPDDEKVRNIDDQYLLGDSRTIGTATFNPGFGAESSTSLGGKCGTTFGTELSSREMATRSMPPWSRSPYPAIRHRRPLWHNTTDTLAHVTLTDLLNVSFASSAGMATGTLHTVPESVLMAPGDTVLVRLRPRNTGRSRNVVGPPTPGMDNGGARESALDYRVRTGCCQRLSRGRSWPCRRTTPPSSSRLSQDLFTGKQHIC